MAIKVKSTSLSVKQLCARPWHGPH